MLFWYISFWLPWSCSWKQIADEGFQILQNKITYFDTFVDIFLIGNRLEFAFKKFISLYEYSKLNSSEQALWKAGERRFALCSTLCCVLWCSGNENKDRKGQTKFLRKKSTAKDLEKKILFKNTLIKFIQICLHWTEMENKTQYRGMNAVFYMGMRSASIVVAHYMLLSSKCSRTVSFSWCHTNIMALLMGPGDRVEASCV